MMIPWRRLLRVRITTLFVLVTLFCVGLAFRQGYLVPYVVQDVAVKQFMDTGASFTFETPQPAWLAPLIGEKRYRKVVVLNIDGDKVYDENLRLLRDFPFVRELYVANNPLGDGGLKDIAQLRRLKRLTLNNTRVSDALMPQIALLNELEFLDLHGTRVTDKGLAALARQRNLREIILGPRITEEGLSQLAKISTLARVDLRSTWLETDDLRALSGSSVQEVELAEHQLPLVGKDLVAFQGLHHLRSLPGEVVDCTEEDLAHLSELKELESINVQGRTLTERAVELILRLPSLRKCSIEGNIAIDRIEMLNESTVGEIRIITPQATRENVMSLRRYQGESKVSIQTPWLTPVEAAVISRELPSNISVSSLMREVMPTVATDDDVTSFSLSDSTAVIEDWRPMLRWSKLQSIQLSLQGRAELPIDAIEKLVDIERYRIRLHRLTPDQARRIIQLPKLEYGAIIVEDLVDGEVREVIRESNEANYTRPADERRTIVFAEEFPFVQNQSAIPQQGMAELRLASPKTYQLTFVLKEPTVGEVDLDRVRPDLQLSALATEPTLVWLELNNSLLRKAQWQQVWKLKNLTMLNIRNCRLTDEDLEGIEQLENLANLSLQNVPITDKALTHIAQLPNLYHLVLSSEQLSFAGPFLSDHGLALLARSSSLQHLVIENQAITGKGFDSWSGNENLQSLTLKDTDLKDEQAAALEKFKKVSYLDVTGSRVTASTGNGWQQGSRLRPARPFSTDSEFIFQRP